MSTRRDFVKALAFAVPSLTCLSAFSAFAQDGSPATQRFLFGASVYPDIDGGGQSKAILDLLEHAHMNVARVGESSWGNLELAPGQFNFGWLREFPRRDAPARHLGHPGDFDLYSAAMAGGYASGDAGGAGTGLGSFRPDEPEVSLPEPSAVSRRLPEIYSGAGRRVSRSSGGDWLAAG